MLMVSGFFALGPNAFAQAPKPAVKPELTKDSHKTAEKEKLIYKIIPALKPDLVTAKPVKKVEEVQDAELDMAKCVQTKSIEQLNKEISLKTNGSIYKTIFEAQSRGGFDAADKAILQLSDCRLMGHILLQRYLYPDSPRIGFSDLKNWMEKYSDHPAADRIYRLTELRRPEGDKSEIKKPSYKTHLTGALEPSLMESGVNTSFSAKRTDEQNSAVKELVAKVNSRLFSKTPGDAMESFNADEAARFMSAVEKARVKENIAHGYMVQGQYKLAIKIAKPLAEKYGKDVPVANWVMGLMSFKSKRYEHAAKYFTKTAHASGINGWLSSGGAFWAARSYFRSGNYDKSDEYLTHAAFYPRTFYGLMALELLGQRADYNWEQPEFGNAQRNILLENKKGGRAYLLTLAEQYSLADAELAGVNPDVKDGMKRALLAFALDKDLPSFALRYGNANLGENERFYDAALYPELPWTPEKGYLISKAFLHALVRQESRFNPRAISPGGAIGLMQLLPSTAAYIKDDESLSGKDKWRLKNPRINLEIGQEYLLSLKDYPSIKENLFYILIAYNAGSGNLSKWQKQLDDVDDSLLFIELMPSAETRSYIEKVMRNYWIYQTRFGEELHSLSALAKAEWPLLKAPETVDN